MSLRGTGALAKRCRSEDVGVVLGERKISLSKCEVNGMEEEQQFLAERATGKLVPSVGSQVSVNPESDKARKCRAEFKGYRR